MAGRAKTKRAPRPRGGGDASDKADGPEVATMAPGEARAFPGQNADAELGAPQRRLRGPPGAGAKEEEEDDNQGTYQVKYVPHVFDFNAFWQSWLRVPAR